MGILGKKLDIILDEIKKIKPSTYIEVGCYQCDTMNAVREAVNPDLMIGFDLFLTAPQYEFPPLDGPPITFQEAKALGFELHKGDTKDTLKVLLDYEMTLPVVVFIDGGHSTETTIRDYEAIKKYVPGATVLIDDTCMPTVKEAIDQIKEEKEFLGLSVIKIQL